MHKIEYICPRCDKKAHMISEFRAFGKINQELSCGCIIITEQKSEIEISQNLIKKKTEPELEQLSFGREDPLWEILRPYQRKGIELAENAGFKFLFLDDMGLGKTLQALGTVHFNWEKLTPAIIVCKQSLLFNWAEEILKFLNSKKNLTKLPFICKHGGILPGFPFYIVSMDSLHKFLNEFIEIEPKTLIIDECHHFKDMSTKRSQELHALARKTPYKLMLSGTPILNYPDEFFSTLNMVRPEIFHNRESFRRTWLWPPDRKGRLKSHKREEFQKLINKLSVRRLRTEVLDELPDFERIFKILDINDPRLIKAYKKGQEKLKEILQETKGSFQQYSSVVGALSVLRQITGIAKSNAVGEEAKEFLSESENSKLAIGIHHKVVSSNLLGILEKYNPIIIDGLDSAETKLEKQRAFQRPENRILIASTLACGEGLNLQFCSTMFQVERQWNSPKEVQFEGRFWRMGQKEKVQATYFICKNTIDEWITNLVEDKRLAIETAIENEAFDPQPETLFVDWRELAELTAKKKLT